MLQGERKTTCPLCGAQLGATIEDQWVPMALDEYREYAAMRLPPNPTVMAAPESCVACGSGNREPRPHVNAEASSRGTGAEALAPQQSL